MFIIYVLGSIFCLWALTCAIAYVWAVFGEPYHTAMQDSWFNVQFNLPTHMRTILFQKTESVEHNSPLYCVVEDEGVRQNINTPKELEFILQKTNLKRN